MIAEDFARSCKRERDLMMVAYLQEGSETVVAAHLGAAALSERQREHVANAIEAALTDGFYTLLMALDGATSLGGCQQNFKVADSEGRLVCNGDGQLEAAAYSAFFPDG
ncbi:MAG TPA: hypothetical protein VFV70_05125 [Hyphomonadaceae bacterium]|nr:hypothetical protein [Hyphomonadaceae bacterium]